MKFCHDKIVIFHHPSELMAFIRFYVSNFTFQIYFDSVPVFAYAYSWWYSRSIFFDCTWCFKIFQPSRYIT